MSGRVLHLGCLHGTFTAHSDSARLYNATARTQLTFLFLRGFPAGAEYQTNGDSAGPLVD